MLRASLPQALRFVAALVLMAALVEVVFFDLVLAAPFAAAGLLFALSFGVARFPRATAGITVLLGIGVPVAAFVAASRGAIPWIVPAFDAVAFGWLAVVAGRTFRAPGPVGSPLADG